jgi:thymidylate synthase (FAD)
VEFCNHLAATGIVPADRETFLTVQDSTWQDLERCRERDECWSKLAALGLVAE